MLKSFIVVAQHILGLHFSILTFLTAKQSINSQYEHYVVSASCSTKHTTENKSTN